MRIRLDRTFFHYEEWEDYQNGMYNESKYGRKSRVNRAFDILSNQDNCRELMETVITCWPVATMQNLSNISCNRCAWLGQAACNIIDSVKEDETREAWRMMKYEQRNKANEIAEEIIKGWESVYVKNL